MTKPRTRDYPYDSESYVTVRVWCGHAGGHASLEVHSEKGNNYLSLFPDEPLSRQDIAMPKRCKLRSLEQDSFIVTPSYGPVRVFPDGMYILVLNKELTNKIYDSMQNIIEEIKKGKIKYSYLNQYTEDHKTNKNFNCSGIVESVLEGAIPVKFGEKQKSTPQRVAAAMLENPETEIIGHDEKTLCVPLPEHITSKNHITIPRSRL